MRTSVAQDVRNLKLRVKRSLARVPGRGDRVRTRYIEPPRKLWDRIVLFMFTCCLITFLHAFLGFSVVDEDLRALDDSFVPPHAMSFPISRPWNLASVASDEGREIRAQAMTRVIVDWHGNYELLPSSTSVSVSPASIPQEAFPDPTPVALVGADRGQAVDEGSLSMTTQVETPVDIPFAFYGTPYDPFRLEFEDFVDGSQNRGLYLVPGPRTAPRGARTRRFGRCLPGETCW